MLRVRSRENSIIIASASRIQLKLYRLVQKLARAALMGKLNLALIIEEKFGESIAPGVVGRRR